VALFRGGSADLVAAFSRWADRRMLARLEDAALSELRLSERIELALRLRIETLDHRESSAAQLVGAGIAVQRSARYAFAVRDGRRDLVRSWRCLDRFQLLHQAATLAGILAAATLYWLEDRSPESADTLAYQARLADLHR